MKIKFHWLMLCCKKKVPFDVKICKRDRNFLRRWLLFGFCLWPELVHCTLFFSSINTYFESFQGFLLIFRWELLIINVLCDEWTDRDEIFRVIRNYYGLALIVFSFWFSTCSTKIVVNYFTTVIKKGALKWIENNSFTTNISRTVSQM